MQQQVKLIKEIREYSEAIYFGLNAYQLVFSFIAGACAVGSYLLLKDTLSKSTISFVCIAAAAPGAFFGFFKYQGMNAFEFLGAVFRYIFRPKQLPYISRNIYDEILAEPSKEGKNEHAKKRERG